MRQRRTTPGKTRGWMKGYRKEEKDLRFGFMDRSLVNAPRKGPFAAFVAITLGLLFLLLVWFLLNQKLLLGEAWLSETYDTPDWRTNEGNLPTHGAWDLETHIWKTQYIIENYPNHQWNPYWYMGMPLLEYYQPAFYFVHWGFMSLAGLDAPRSALLLVLLGHLAATYLTFFLCYLVSRRALVSALCATFVLANTFLSLRSYGWEPITVVFLLLYPLGLYVFLREPLRPFRLSVILLLAVAFLSHPLIFFSLCMAMGLYLLPIALKDTGRGSHARYLWSYFGAVGASILIGAVQFFTQMNYEQATSGAHMGLSYLPYYHVPFNIISLQNFFFSAGDLKGPGPIIMIAALLLIIFAARDYVKRKERSSRLLGNQMVVGLTLTLFMMVLFYYLELFNLFPMNLLRSIQYHRIIPEFIITAAVLVAVLSNVSSTFRMKALYYPLLIGFVLASGILIYNIQEYWQTTDTLEGKPELITDEVPGRITFPYTDQSLSVRNSFTYVPQVYGYYEQGITNPYADELFSVSSGFHSAELTVLYLKATNTGRLYVNTEEGFRDRLMMDRMNQTHDLVVTDNPRYAYYEIPLEDPSFVETVDLKSVREIEGKEPGCRVIYRVEYCGSFREEFVTVDPEEILYLAAYVDMLEQPYAPQATLVMDDPEHYRIEVTDADRDTAIIVKMTYDENFDAVLAGRSLDIEPIGPHFMLIRPDQEGEYTVRLEYHTSTARSLGIVVSLGALAILLLYFMLKPFSRRTRKIGFPDGDMR